MNISSVTLHTIERRSYKLDCCSSFSHASYVTLNNKLLRFEIWQHMYNYSFKKKKIYQNSLCSTSDGHN